VSARAGEPWGRVVWGRKVGHAERRIVASKTTADGKEPSAEKPPAFFVEELHRDCLGDPSWRLVHDDAQERRTRTLELAIYELTGNMDPKPGPGPGEADADPIVDIAIAAATLSSLVTDPRVYRPATWLADVAREIRALASTLPALERRMTAEKGGAL
jgi:hypothetical protein